VSPADEDEDAPEAIEDSDGEEETSAASPMPAAENQHRLTRFARNSIGFMNSLGIRKPKQERGADDSDDAPTERQTDDKATVRCADFNIVSIIYFSLFLFRSSWFRSKINDMSISDSMDVPESVDFMPANYDLEGDGDLRLCPACIEASDHRKEGRRRLLFVIPHSMMPDPKTASKFENLVPRLRSYAEYVRALPTIPIPKQPKNKKLSVQEKRRRHIVESFKSLLDKNTAGSAQQISNFLLPFTDRYAIHRCIF